MWGGANSIRAFNVRGIGPGKQDYSDLSNKYANILRTGDIKFQANLEYRPRIWGDLYGEVLSIPFSRLFNLSNT